MSEQGGQAQEAHELDLTSARSVQLARSNSKMAAIAAIIATVTTAMAILASSIIARTRNQVAAIPVGQAWDFPMVHWVNAPSRYDEDAKPLHVAQKYVRGLYEVDSLDFSEVSSGSERVMLSNRMAELLAYTIPGTKEHLKVSSALERSQTLFKLYSECKCLKRFLVSDMMISQPPLAALRIEMVGRFVIFGQDGRRPLPAEDLGLKSITIHLAHDIPLFERGSEEGGGGSASQTAASGPKAVNPEGWYVTMSQIRSLTEQDLKDLRQIRVDSGMKWGL